MPLSRSAWRHVAIHFTRASAVKFGSTSSMNIKWSSMASMASMRSSGVAGLSCSFSIFALCDCSDIDAAAAMVAKGAGFISFVSCAAVGGVLMTALSLGCC